METHIETGVPLPPRRVGGLTATLRKLNVNDSFLYPKDLRNSVAPTAKQLGIKVTTAVVDETVDGKQAVRVWRIE